MIRNPLSDRYVKRDGVLGRLIVYYTEPNEAARQKLSGRVG